MTTVIQDLAAKLNRDPLTLNEESLGSERVAGVLRRAFTGKDLALREANGAVSTNASLQFQAVADLFLGVYRQSVRVLAFLEGEQIECVLLATLPPQWDFSWGYPDLPDYSDISDPFGDAKPSFFSELRFADGLTAVFSSCDLSQVASEEALKSLKELDPAIDWRTVRQGLNYRGELDLAAAPFMSLLCQFAGVNSSLPVSGALYHNEFGDEIRLQAGLSLDTRGLEEGLPFKINVSALELSSSVSLFDPVPQSRVGFLGQISFGAASQDSYEVALHWPIGGKELILLNVGPIPFPGVDKFLPATDPSHEALNEIPKNDWDACQIREIVLGVSWDPLSITSCWLSVGSPDGWKVPLLPEDLKNVISIEEYVLRFELRPRVEVSAEAAFTIGGGLVHLSGVYPDLTFAGTLAPFQEIDASRLLSLFLPAGSGNGSSSLATSSLKILDLDVEADFKQHIYAFDLEISSLWEISIGGVKALPLRRLRLSLEKEGDYTSVSLAGVCTIAGIDLYLEADYMGDSEASEWNFYGKSAPDRDISFGDLMKGLVEYIGGDENSFPRALESFVVRNLRAEIHIADQSEPEVNFHCEGEWAVADNEGQDLLVDLSVTVTRKTDNGARITTFAGELTVGDLDFTLTFVDEKTTNGASDLLVATYSHDSSQRRLNLGELLQSVAQDETELTRALDSVEIDLKDALFAYSKTGEQKKFLFGFDIGARISLKDLPLVGKEFSADSNAGIDNLQAVVAWKPFTRGEVQRLNALLPNNVNKLPEATKTSGAAGSEATDSEDNVSDPTTEIALREGLTIGATLNLGNISRPLALPAASPSTALPEAPAASGPAAGDLQPADTGGTPVATTIDNATWLKIQKSFGPVHFERVGAQYKDANVSFLLDAALTAAGLTLSLDGLSAGSPVGKFEPRFELRGLGIDYRSEALEIGGAFLKIADSEYAGAAVIKARQLTLSALGMYKEMADGHPSMFVYASLDYPIGGPSFFFVTGLAAGFGYSRALKTPTIDKVASFSLVENARNRAAMPEDVNAELQKLRNDITPAAGENFLAIGVKFTSFKVVDSFALLTASFGGHFEMNLLGLSTLVAPSKVGAGVPPVAEAQLALKASFLPDTVFLGAQGQLTPTSYLLSKACHLTGGFAFFSWFTGSEHDGDFVLTLGGYHPQFRAPEHYPTVPRLGFNWQVSDELSLKGDAYFALTAAALMAGGHLEANWISGSIHAWFKLVADFLIAWQPYHYEISAYVDIGAEVTFQFFGTRHLSFEVGAELNVWGPAFSGEAAIHWGIISFTLAFGDAPRQTPSPIDWPGFKSSFLPGDKDVCSVAVTDGLIGKDSQDAASLGVINPRHFSLATNCVIPSTTARYELKNATQTISLDRSPGRFGIGPMAVAASDLTSTQTITITRDGDFAGGDFDYTPVFKKVPAGLWGESLTPELNGKQFVEDALSGFEIRPKVGPKPDETELTIDGIRFLQNHLPGLIAGDYEITVEQEVKRQGEDLDKFTTARKFSVRGDRLALKPTDAQAVFPPAGSLGDHSNVMPHILLNRSTLPWERRADPNDSETPWLALLLFYEEEAPTPEIVSLKDLNGSPAKFPPFTKERWQSDDDKVTVIDVPKKILDGILPRKEELALLAHVREATDYVITDQTLAALKTEAVPDDILLKLAGLKEQEFIGADEFLAALKNAIGEQQTTERKEKIAKYAAVPVETAVIIGNRLPRPKGVSAAYLVSVEDRYNSDGFDYQGAGDDDLIRLVSLRSWSFACIDHQQSFTGLLTRLNRTPSVLRLPDDGADAANEYLAPGSLPLSHGLRQGGKTVSLYHGPLAPAENRLSEEDLPAPDLPARAADELIRYNPATGMFDVSYAAAWELGRLLTLQSKNLSVNLYNWKRAHAQQLRQIEEELLHTSPLDDGSGQEPGPIPVPPDIAGWFKRLSLMEGVPFNYLVPDERLLPLESIRFFQLDRLWIECLLDGAFSIGRVTAADHRRDAAHVKSPAANPHAKVSGALIRSEVVAGWPGLLMDGFSDVKKLKLLRMDRLSANVLLCLFEGDVTAVDLRLRPETAHFGFDRKEGASSGFFKKLRYRNGDESDRQIDTIPWRQTLPGTIDVSKLCMSINEAVKDAASPFTSAQFASQMIETSDKMRFQLTASGIPQPQSGAFIPAGEFVNV